MMICLQQAQAHAWLRAPSSSLNTQAFILMCVLIWEGKLQRNEHPARCSKPY